MKKVLISIFLILICYFGYAQYPLQQNLGSASTLVNIPANGSIRGGLITISFVDTVAANLANIKYYDGAIIKTTSPIIALWYRHLATTQWIQILPSGGSGGQRAWLIGGQAGIFTSPVDPQMIGTTTNQGWGVLTNSLKRFVINNNGAFGVGTGEDYGTAGWLLSTNGSGTAPTWVNPSTLITNIYNSDGTLTGNRTVTGSGNQLDFQMGGGDYVIQDAAAVSLSDQNNSSLVVQNGVTLSQSNGGSTESQFILTKDSITLYPYNGHFEIDTLLNKSGQNTLMGWIQTAGATRGEVGYVTLGSGLSIGAGVLSSSAPSGSGTTNTIPKWTPNGTTLGNSSITDDGTNVGFPVSAGVFNLGGGATAAELRFLEPSASGTNYFGIKAQAMAANQTYLWPSAVGAANTVLTDVAGNGTLSFAAIPAPSLTSTYIGYGDGSNLLTGSSGLTYSASNFVVNTQGFQMGDIPGTNNSAILNFESADDRLYFTNTPLSAKFGINTIPTVALDVVGDMLQTGNTVTTGTFQMSNFGAGAATFDASGNISSVSDERLKTNIKPYKTGLKELLLIKPIQYKWNEQSKMETAGTYAGFSAQNVKANIPLGTGENKDGYLSLQDRAIMATLVNAVQELNAKVEKLEKQNAELVKKLAKNPKKITLKY